MNTDYAMRRSNFDHVVIIDLEVFGIYTPPRVKAPSHARDFAYGMLARKEFSDMDIVTRDSIRIPVNSRILAYRWPMFTEVLNTCVTGTPHASDMARRPSVASTLFPQNADRTLTATERPRVLYLPLKHDQAEAFLTYLYTDSLPSGLDVPTLCTLLVLSKRYAPSLDRLAGLVADVLHRQLNEGNAWQIIEAAALSGRSGLQVEAMLVMRTAADLKLQAQRRREELKNKGSLVPLKNGDTNGTAVGSVVSTHVSTQSADGSSVVVPSVVS